MIACMVECVIGVKMSDCMYGECVVGVRMSY